MRIVVSTSISSDLERALQASIDRRQRLEELARTPTRSAASSVTTPGTTSGTMPGQWLAHGSSATVAGFATGSFVYVGEQLQALNQNGEEPSLIDPSLPVHPERANTLGENVTYWPSYRGLSPDSRRAFLEWLDSGRRDPHAYIGYVFVFFYGLERRAYEFMQGRASNADEMLAIAREVARLLDLYADRSRSFASYGSALLDFIATLEPRARDLVHDREQNGGGPSHSLRFALGTAAGAGKPIPAQHAFDWVRACSTLNTPATRCASEFELLFHIRYAKQFGDGMIVKPGTVNVTQSYQPASSGLPPITDWVRDVPDITFFSHPLQALVTIASECTNALDAFSRFIGKNPNGREALSAYALLPEELVEAMPSTDAASLASLVRSRLDEDGRAHLGASELLQYVRLAKPGKVSKSEAMLLAQALEKLGYGMEPDVRLGGPVCDVDGRLIVFRRLPDCPSTASDEYATATLCMRLGAIVSAADDEVSREERALLQKHIADTLQLSAGERQRLAAHLVWLIESKPGTSGLKKQLAALTLPKRHHIGQLLITIAASDARVDPRELKMLEKMYALVGLEISDLKNDIQIALAAAKPRIDMDRVRLKIAETREVSALLSTIFVEDEQPIVVAPAVVQSNTIGTLDAAHSELLRRLATRESWPRDEVERIASELSLLTDGALETINDYAYATASEAFWEDDDPVLINQTVARELTA